MQGETIQIIVSIIGSIIIALDIKTLTGLSTLERKFDSLSKDFYTLQGEHNKNSHKTKG